jgi:hypothetical protein
MNELQEILNKLEELGKRISSIETQLANKAGTPIFCEPEPINPFRPKGGDPWGGLPITDGPNSIFPKVIPKTIGELPEVLPKLIDGHVEIMKPLVFDTDASDIIQAARAEYEKNKEALLQKWRDNPEMAPRYNFNSGEALPSYIEGKDKDGNNIFIKLNAP